VRLLLRNGLSCSSIILNQELSTDMRILTFLSALLFLAGCADTVPMVLSQDHPANPDAAAAPATQPSTTLALTVPPASAPTHGGEAATHAAHAGPAVTPPASSPSVKAAYVCAMHPEVVSDQPARCPKCKMKLVRKGGGR
jgi:hypothetical protein